MGQVSARATDPAWAEHVEEQNADYWADARKALREVPEPAELTAQAAAIAAARKVNETRCAKCDEPRWSHGWKASTLTSACQFEEPSE